MWITFYYLFIFHSLFLMELMFYSLQYLVFFILFFAYQMEISNPNYQYQPLPVSLSFALSFFSNKLYFFYLFSFLSNTNIFHAFFFFNLINTKICNMRILFKKTKYHNNNITLKGLYTRRLVRSSASYWLFILTYTY